MFLFNIFHELENNYMDINASDLKYSSTSQEHIITDFSN